MMAASHDNGRSPYVSDTRAAQGKFDTDRNSTERMDTIAFHARQDDVRHVLRDDGIAAERVGAAPEGHTAFRGHQGAILMAANATASSEELDGVQDAYVGGERAYRVVRAFSGGPSSANALDVHALASESDTVEVSSARSDAVDVLDHRSPSVVERTRMRLDAHASRQGIDAASMRAKEREKRATQSDVHVLAEKGAALEEGAVGKGVPGEKGPARSKGIAKGKRLDGVALASVGADVLLDGASESDELDGAASAIRNVRGARGLIARMRARKGLAKASARAAQKMSATRHAKKAAKLAMEANKARAAATAAKAAGAAASAMSSGGGGAAAAVGGGGILTIIIPVILALFVVAGASCALTAFLQDQAADAGSLEGNEATIASFLLNKGLDAEHVAGIVGNFAVESGCNPRLVENNATTQALGLAGEHDNYPPELIDIDNVGYGIAQWSYHSRARALVDYAASVGSASGDLQVQCDFFWIEFSGSVAAYEEVSGLEETTRWFHNVYERSADGEEGMQRRIAEASRIYTAMATAASGDDTVSRAYGQIGKVVYTWGGCQPGFMDCSGFVSYCLTGEYRRIGTTETFLRWPRPDVAVPGDICVNSTHCGVYVGNGLMIDCGNSGVGQPRTIDPGMVIVRYPG